VTGAGVGRARRRRGRHWALSGGHCEGGLDRNRGVERQGCDADSGAGVTALIAERRDHQVGGAIQHLRPVEKIRRGIDEAAKPDHADYLVEVTERGKVLNRAWRRYGTVNSIALTTLVAGWLPARLNEARPRWLSPAERRAAVAKDIAMGAVVLTGLASALSGVEFAQQAPGGAVPMQSGSAPAPETPPRAARLKHLVNTLGALNLGAEVALVVANATLSQIGFRRPPVRRVLRRRY